MPFQSEKQRKYLHANHPEIAKRWERDYANGGISNLFKLKEGGNIRLQPHTASDLLVQKKSSGERPKYQPPGHTDAPSRSSDSGGHSQHATANVTSRPASTPSYKSVHDTGAVTQTPGRTTTPDKGDGVYQDRIIELADRKRKSDLKDIVAQGEKTEKWEKAQKWQKPNKFMSFLGKAALAIIPGLLPAKMATTWNIGKLGWDITKTDRYDRYFELAGINKNEWLSKIGSIEDSKRDLIQSLPKGHPERIALEAQMKVRTPPTEDKDGATTSIKIENIEEVNDDKTQLLKKYEEMDQASYAAWLRQQEMEAKKQAYLRNFRQTYMSAQGGRVPAGYNTGGLSNLFRLKNR